MKYCTNCGKALEDDAKFCSGCGKAVKVDSFQPTTPAAATQEVPKVRATVVTDSGSGLQKKLSILFLIGAVLTALFLLLTPKAGGMPVLPLLLCLVLPIAAWIVCFVMNRRGTSLTKLFAGTVVSVFLAFLCGGAIFAGDVSTTLFHAVLLILALVILGLMGMENAKRSK